MVLGAACEGAQAQNGCWALQSQCIGVSCVFDPYIEYGVVESVHEDPRKGQPSRESFPQEEV